MENQSLDLYSFLIHYLSFISCLLFSLLLPLSHHIVTVPRIMTLRMRTIIIEGIQNEEMIIKENEEKQKMKTRNPKSQIFSFVFLFGSKLCQSNVCYFQSPVQGHSVSRWRDFMSLSSLRISSRPRASS